jgi:hypothetical protein
MIMANKSVFASLAGRLLPKATATNAHGAKACAYDAEHRLAQLAMTGTVGGGFYQAAERADVLNIGGFFDAVFDQIADFAAGRMDPDHWVGEIRAVSL